ncbi:hypothetical protein ACJRO7_009756 [Eucalyptus globulus]|uniref:Uncharacterized protein n=1 Tax=Eucalyptus globulus TaxID=34317 RepID=A0ABD3LAX4_EUCGL
MGIVTGMGSRGLPSLKEWRRLRTWGRGRKLPRQGRGREGHVPPSQGAAEEDAPDERVTCVVADETIGWAFDVAKSMGIKAAMFWPNAVPGLALTLSIPQLIEAGVIDVCGT